MAFADLFNLGQPLASASATFPVYWSGGYMERCQNCQRDGERVEHVSRVAYVDYYRCPSCGQVWTAPKTIDRLRTVTGVQSTASDTDPETSNTLD